NRDGARVDIDYDFFPEWSSQIVARGCRARANGDSGLHYDLDSSSTALVHRLSSSANVGNGFLLTSETFPGMCTVSASALFGNQGSGVRGADGHYGLTISHCVLAGNVAGGSSIEIAPALAQSCIAHLQPLPFQDTGTLSDVIQDQALPPVFVNSPSEFLSVT